MGDISISKTREIVEDFAKLIKEKAEAATPPLKTVVEFRRMRQKGLECDVYEIPIKLLRYRKENGRIASDVLSYEKEHGTLNERKEEDQKILREFLKNKSKLEGIVNRVPDNLMTQTAKEFTVDLMCYNLNKLGEIKYD